MGLRRLGIRFRHATMPRGKLIERVFGSLTDLTMMLPGYAGRNQMTDRYEDTHHRALRAKPRPDASVREHPKDLGFLHRSQLVEYIEEIARKLNSTVMRGEYHQKCVGGKTIFLSPNEAYEEFFAVPLEPLVSADATPEALSAAARSSAIFQFYQREVSRTLKPVIAEISLAPCLQPRKKIRATDAKEVGVENPAEETFRYPNQNSVSFSLRCQRGKERQFPQRL